MMDYLDWIRALDRAHQYAELNDTVLTSLHQFGAVFRSYGYLSHDDISKAIIAAASQQRDDPKFGYFVHDQDRGWVKQIRCRKNWMGFLRTGSKKSPSQ